METALPPIRVFKRVSLVKIIWSPINISLKFIQEGHFSNIASIALDNGLNLNNYITSHAYDRPVSRNI